MKISELKKTTPNVITKNDTIIGYPQDVLNHVLKEFVNVLNGYSIEKLLEDYEHNSMFYEQISELSWKLKHFDSSVKIMVYFNSCINGFTAKEYKGEN